MLYPTAALVFNPKTEKEEVVPFRIEKAWFEEARRAGRIGVRTSKEIQWAEAAGFQAESGSVDQRTVEGNDPFIVVYNDVIALDGVPGGFED